MHGLLIFLFIAVALWSDHLIFMGWKQEDIPTKRNKKEEKTLTKISEINIFRTE